MTPWDTSFKWPKLEYYSFTLYDSKFIFTSMPSFPESRRKLNSSIKAAHISRLLHILTCQGHMVISVPCWINLRQIFHITRALCQTEVETSAMLPRRPIMFLKRSDMLGKASLHWRKTCKRLLGVHMLGNDVKRPPCHSCPRNAHYWQESHLSHSTWRTRLCPSPRRRILNSFLIFSALKDNTKYTSSQSSISSLSLIIRSIVSTISTPLTFFWSPST